MGGNQTVQLFQLLAREALWQNLFPSQDIPVIIILCFLHQSRIGVTVQGFWLANETQQTEAQ